MAETIRKAVDAASASWSGLEGVIMVAQGEDPRGRDCIQVSLSCRRADLKVAISETFMGFPVVVIEDMEEIRAQ